MLKTLSAMQNRLASSPHLGRIGALFSETVLLQIDQSEFYLVFENGRLSRIIEGPSMKIPYRFAFVTDAGALGKFWQPRPEPGFHDIFAMVKTGRAKILGDILSLVKNLRFFKEFMALGRNFEGVAS